MSREDAYSMYRNLQESVINILKMEPKNAKLSPDQVREGEEDCRNIFGKTKQIDNWTFAMLGIIGILATVKCVVSLLLLFGFLRSSEALAFENVSANSRPLSTPEFLGVSGGPEQRLFEALDERRAVLERRNRQLEDRESSLREQEEELAVRLAELRQLTAELRAHRSAEGAAVDAQVEQLSKVYVSMKPEEAASLLQELDIMIAFELIKIMPEKRIGQLLALMESKKSLLITKMLAGYKNVK
jgi:flagellar motility protein MotE (MotC chaperone)